MSPGRGHVVGLYVPGSRPERFEKAAASGAALVIVDLEDSVAPADKAAARSAVSAWLSSGLSSGRVTVQVRVNAPGSPDLEQDLAALPASVPVRLPKVTGPGDLDAVIDLGGARTVHALVESALGVEHAFEIARHPAVASVALGEADLAAELGLSGDEAFAWIRSRLVVAARAAGLPAPMMSAYPDLADLDGLRRSCAAGRRLGLHGRSAVHPTQVPVIAAAFAVTADEQAWARAVLAALESGGVARLPDGAMVDAAMARQAREILG